MNGCGGSETSQKKEKSKAPHVNPDVWGTQIRIRICRPGHPPSLLGRRSRRHHLTSLEQC